MDKSKLIKLLNLTTSPNDNEALTAMRMANKLLVKLEITWEELFGSAGKKAERHGAYEYDFKPAGKTVREMFSDLKFADYKSDFVDSLFEQFQKRGQLSQKQKDWLKKIHAQNCRDEWV